MLAAVASLAMAHRVPCHFDQLKGLLQTLKSLPPQGLALAVQTI